MDLIVTRGSIFVQGARKATSSIPIVFTMHADPEGTGHVASLARPGGSITGLSLLQTEINRKGFEILISTVPAAKRIAVLYNPAKAMTDAEATAAILAHLERMDRADVILVFNQDGYVGNSVAMEIGYAYSRRKPLYALQPIPDQFLMGLLSGVVSPKKFIELTCSASSTPVDPRRPKGK